MAVSDPTPVEDLDRYHARIVAGDPKAFEVWLAGAERSVRETLRPFAREVDTEAVMQEALLRLWLVVHQFVPDGRPNGLLRLAIRIARNFAVSELRRNRLDPATTDELERAADALAENPRSVTVPDPRLRAVIRQCWENLPVKPARAMTERLRNAGEEADDTLAARLGMRKNTFLQNITRARKLLGDCLKRSGVNLGEELS